MGRPAPVAVDVAARRIGCKIAGAFVGLHTQDIDVNVAYDSTADSVCNAEYGPQAVSVVSRSYHNDDTRSEIRKPWIPDRVTDSLASLGLGSPPATSPRLIHRKVGMRRISSGQADDWMITGHPLLSSSGYLCLSLLDK